MLGLEIRSRQRAQASNMLSAPYKFEPDSTVYFPSVSSSRATCSQVEDVPSQSCAVPFLLLGARSEISHVDVLVLISSNDEVLIIGKTVCL